MMDIRNLAGDVLFSAAVGTVKELVIAAVKAEANLRGADLCEANLRGAMLCEAKEIPARAVAQMQQIPEEGAFIGWKKCKDGVIVKLQIPEQAKRSHGTGRKCRASEVIVLDVFGADVGISLHESKTEYRKGATIIADEWDDDRWNACSHGIHFFITRLEAEDY